MEERNPISTWIWKEFYALSQKNNFYLLKLSSKYSSGSWQNSSWHELVSVSELGNVISSCTMVHVYLCGGFVLSFASITSRARSGKYDARWWTKGTPKACQSVCHSYQPTPPLPQTWAKRYRYKQGLLKGGWYARNPTRDRHVPTFSAMMFSCLSSVLTFIGSDHSHGSQRWKDICLH